LLQGTLFESNKKEAYYLIPGSLIFHNWQDAHYNKKPPEFTRGFHIELNDSWFLEYDIKTQDFEGSINLKSPIIKNLIQKVFIESKVDDDCSKLSIDATLIELFDSVKDIGHKISKRPSWAIKLKELLFEEDIDYSLKHLSACIGIHPTHLSREFHRHFGTSLGEYVRLIKLNKAFYLISSNKFSMTEICYKCGFYDQSHFITNFKRIYNTTPTKLLKEIR
jgi:AraC-like DNA-binding protein